jgi:hypothetical protein
MRNSSQSEAEHSTTRRDGRNGDDTAPLSRSSSRVDSVVGNVAGFGENVLTLAELQTRLAVLELRENVQAATRAGRLLLAGFVLAMASVPIALVATSELLISELGFKRGYAYLVVAGASGVIAGLCLLVGRLWVHREWLGFPLSGEELTRNLNWIRAILRHSGRARVRP